MIHILLVDDHKLLRQGTRVLLYEDPEIEVVAESAQGEEALTLAQRLRPDGEELIAAVRAVQRGEQVLSPQIAGQLAARERHSNTATR